ncbi:MAG TPA: hypothetical protein VHV77_18655 [Pirellulales bacterium]|nr:hypothetical protein [Pirellulales bacterium]
MKSIAVLAFVGVLVLPVLADADHHHHRCPQCGCHQLKKVCRVVPVTEKITTTCYTSKCEDFCVPGKSCLLGERCYSDCNGCHTEKVWQPNCGKVYTRRVLVKENVTREKPGYKCVVETCCCKCGCNCNESGSEPCVNDGSAPAAP